MALIRPFKAIRPNREVAAQVAALPYDVYNREEACAEVAGKPLSFLNIDRAETQFGPETHTYAECVYDKARELLEARRADGTFIQDDQEGYYIYMLTMNGRSQTGIVACASIDDYQDNIIKKHENTRADKEADRIHHVDACNAQTGPIFLAYRGDVVINAITAKIKMTEPLYDFISDDGVRHTVWRITQEGDIFCIQNSFSEMNNIYIADGHHRAASAVKVGLKRRAAKPDYDGTEEFNYFLSVLFPDSELSIMDYNRVVKDLNGYDADAFVTRISENFNIEEVAEGPYSPEAKGIFGMFLDEKWYKLTAKEQIMSADAVDGLDVSILQWALLTPVLGIGDPRTDARIDFVGGIRGLDELERRCHTDMRVAFSMYPTSIAELFSVADAKRLMPPKSTWFEPKLRSGLFIHTL